MAQGLPKMGASIFYSFRLFCTEMFIVVSPFILIFQFLNSVEALLVFVIYLVFARFHLKGSVFSVLLLTWVFKIILV